MLVLDIITSQIIILIILIALSAFFSASEIALLSLGRITKHQMVKDKVKNSEIIAKLLDDPNRLLITILIGNNLVNVSASAIDDSMNPPNIRCSLYFGLRSPGVSKIII